MTQPNKALQLTPDSSFQSIRGTVASTSASPPALAVSAVWRRWSAQSRSWSAQSRSWSAQSVRQPRTEV